MAEVSQTSIKTTPGQSGDADSETGSVNEEERIRRLFQACDGDGDGYIDSEDLLLVCRELNLEDSVEELMRELGADDQGRISYQEFLRRRLALRPEIEALKQQSRYAESTTLEPPTTSTPEYLPTSSDNSLGATSGGKHESWEFDSGARDLSPEPNTLQKLVEAAGGSVTGSTSNLLELANKLHLAALASLKGEILDLTSRLHNVTQERDLLEKSLNKIELEKIHLVQDTEDRLDLQAQRYEERLTELHSVIAELSRKIDRQKSLVIQEEEEEGEGEGEGDGEEGASHSPDSRSQLSHDVSENDYNDLSRDVEGSTTNPVEESELQDQEAGERTACSVSRGDADSSSADIDARAVEAGRNMEDLDQPLNKETGTSCHSLQMAALHEELGQLRSENLALQEQLGCQEAELNRARALIGGLRDERDRLRKKIRELQTKMQQQQQQLQQQQQEFQQSQAQQQQGTHVSPEHCSQTGSQTVGKNVTSSVAINLSVVPRDEMPVLKMAERVKLRKMESGDRHVTGSELSSLGLSNTKVAEHLVQELQEESSMQEICHSLGSAGCQLSESKIREFEIETERLNSRIEHLKSQNDVLALTLEESKTQCDRLSLLVGKYESNNTALQLALGYSDQAIEAYDVLVALLESELGLLLANCRAAGIGRVVKNSEDEDNEEAEVSALLKRANENRRSAETVARHLLSRLDRNSGLNPGGVPPSNVPPWEDGSMYSHTTSTSSSSGAESDWSQGEERRLREHIGKLKVERGSVRTTVLELESVHADPLTRQPISLAEARKLDLETAVLMQELMAMREDKAELRARVYLLEKERAALELKLSSHDAQQQAQVATIQHLQGQLQESERLLEVRKKKSEANGTEEDQEKEEESELGEALRRESKLKDRLQEMVSTLEKVSKNSELRHQQSADLVNDLKRANSALVQTLEKSKKKYQSRLKKLEQQMLTMVERHSSQVRTLKQRITVLEDEIAISKTNQPGHSSGASETSL